MIFTTSGRIIAFAWKNFTRNAWIGLATILVLVLSLLSVNILLGVNAVSDAALRKLEDKIDISVYFKQGTSQIILDSARSYMASLPQTAYLELVGPDQALADFKERHKNDEKITAALGELDQNPFGASLIIKARQTSDYAFLIEALQNPQFAANIESKTYDDNAAAIDQVRRISQSVRYFGMLLIAVFAVFSMMIVYNSIRIAIYTQREEIGIMRLVGASDSFVRLPLILSGILQAVLAVLLTAGMVFLAVTFFDARLRSFFDGGDPGLLGFFSVNLWTLVGVQVSAIFVLVTVASWAAAGKYLKK